MDIVEPSQAVRVTEANAYRTVDGRGTARLAARDSVFIGRASPVDSVETAERFIDDVRAEHDDATHNVPAYRVRTDPFREYATDDGEPSGSAGKPILSMLQGRELQNVAVVVTRYYGGTELGIGGLVRAYTRAAADAVDTAVVVDRAPRERLFAVVEYDDSGTVRGILESEGVAFDAEYTERVRFEIVVPVDDAAALCDRLRSATSGRIEL